MIFFGSAVSLLVAPGLAEGPPTPISEFVNPAIAHHEIILRCGLSSGVVRWRVAPNFHLDEFVLDRFVASDADLAPINEATATFGEQSMVVVRCNEGKANIYIYDFSNPRDRQVRLFGFSGAGFYPILSKP